MWWCLLSSSAAGHINVEDLEQVKGLLGAQGARDLSTHAHDSSASQHGPIVDLQSIRCTTRHNTTRTSDHAMCVWLPHCNIAPPTTSASQASPLRVNTPSSLALGFLMLALISIMVVLGMAGNELSKEPSVSDKDDVSNVTYAKTADEDVVNAKVHYSYFIRLRHNTCANTSTHSHTSTPCLRMHAPSLLQHSAQVHK